MKSKTCTGAEPSVKTKFKQPEFDFSPTLWDGVRITKEIKELKETVQVLKYQLTNAQRYEPKEVPELKKDLQEAETKLNKAKKELQEITNKYSTIKEDFDEEDFQKDLEKAKTRKITRKEAMLKWHPDKFIKDKDHKKFEDSAKILNAIFDKIDKTAFRETKNQTADEAFKRNWEAQQKRKNFEEALRKKKAEENKRTHDPAILNGIKTLKNIALFEILFEYLIKINISQEKLQTIAQAMHRIALVTKNLKIDFTLQATLQHYIIPNAKIIKNHIKTILDDINIPSIYKNQLKQYLTALEYYVSIAEKIYSKIK
ncbi:MAG: hypothetical protein LBF97_00135 [Elusimicrobiota bacterium]|jgi:chromosome segregation ATPase|nr:hypothetical protein [Elusimicrobiota bacterium]